MGYRWTRQADGWRKGDTYVPDSSGPPGAVTFGMYTNMPERLAAGDSYDNFLITKDRMGGDLCNWRRTFSSGLPSTIPTDVATGVSNGIRVAHSVKADIASVIAGNSAVLNTVESFAASLPDGSMLMSYHEPENDGGFIGANLGDFVPYQQNFYTAVKNGNPTVLFGYCAMEYQWQVSAATDDWADWYPGDDYCDWLSIDVYCMEYENTRTLTNKSGYMKWHANAVASGKPWGIHEYGHTWADNTGNGTHTDANTAAVISTDIDWLVGQGIDFLFHWNASQMSIGAGSERDWAICGAPDGYTDALGAQLGDNRPLSRQAWLDKVAQYGRPSSASPIGE